MSTDHRDDNDREPHVALETEGAEPAAHEAPPAKTGSAPEPQEDAVQAEAGNMEAKLAVSDNDTARRERRKAERARRREALRKPAGGGWRARLQSARKVALVVFGVVGAYLMGIYLDLLLKVFTLKHLSLFHPALQKYLLTPLAFEGGFVIASLVVLYLLGRFVDLPLWPALLAMVIGIHAFDFGVKHVLQQSGFAYMNLRLWLLRLPLILLSVFLGRLVLKLALLREEGAR